MSTPNKFIPVFFSILFLSGCAKLAHLEQLLTLKAVSEEGEAQDKFVAGQTENFDKLLSDIKTGALKDYSSKADFLADYGEPIFKRPAGGEEAMQEVWLYRYPKAYFKGDRVYIYFDDTGKMVKYERQSGEPQTQFAQQEMSP